MAAPRNVNNNNNSNLVIGRIDQIERSDVAHITPSRLFSNNGGWPVCEPELQAMFNELAKKYWQLVQKSYSAVRQEVILYNANPANEVKDTGAGERKYKSLEVKLLSGEGPSSHSMFHVNKFKFENLRPLYKEIATFVNDQLNADPNNDWMRGRKIQHLLAFFNGDENALRVDIMEAFFFQVVSVALLLGREKEPPKNFPNLVGNSDKTDLDTWKLIQTIVATEAKVFFNSRDRSNATFEPRA